MEHVTRKPKRMNRNQKNAILVILLTLLMMVASCIAGYAGCVYIDPHNKSDMSDENTVIYGHNMRNGTMFAMLANYKNPEFYKTDRKVYYLTSDGRAFMLEPFAGYVTVGSDAYVQVSFADDEDFMDYVNAKIERSTFKSEIQIKPDDQIVTLSTCSYHTNDGRFALFCKSTEIDVEQALVM